MKIRLIILVFLLCRVTLVAQSDTYTISKTSFSSDNFNEFAPVFYKGGLVFCSDRNIGMSKYSTIQGQSVFKMYYVDTTPDGKWRFPVLFSKDLKTKLNDGPASFNATYDTIFYSRNLLVDDRVKMMSLARNKLGIYYAVFEGKGWGKIREMRFNNEWYNITTPSLSHDGTRLYFASDRTDGFGGMDIYYCEWKDGYWEDPVNLGPEINTSGNESYPFINESDELFFSSDGYQGYGGKDIYITRQKGEGWYAPVRLEEPINSRFDDFSIVADPLLKNGYFASRRDNSVDIYQFRSNTFHIWFSEPQKENNYCFSLSNAGTIQIDTTWLRYEWVFSGGDKIHGSDIQYCFPGPGLYSVTQNVVDMNTDKVLFTKLSFDVELKDFEQPYIHSADFALPGEPVDFDGLGSFIGDNEAVDYLWEYGDGSVDSGVQVKHVFTKPGDYNVKLCLVLKSKLTGTITKQSVSKQIGVRNNSSGGNTVQRYYFRADSACPDIYNFENARVIPRYSAESEYTKGAVFQVELISSERRIDMNAAFFRNVPAEYSLKEFYDSEKGIYSYIIDEQLDMLSAFPAYHKAVSKGYKDTYIRLFVLTTPAEKELNFLMRNYGTLANTYFDVNNNLAANAYLMLDQVTLLMEKYPDIKLEIGVHTDDQGLPSSSITFSKNQAQLLVNFLINRGVNYKRLTAKGYGGIRPVSSNMTEAGRKLNRRVIFTIINDN